LNTLERIAGVRTRAARLKMTGESEGTRDDLSKMTGVGAREQETFCGWDVLWVRPYVNGIFGV